MDTLKQDLRYAIRMLLKSPGLTLVAIVSLALGIGANTTIFSWVKSILLQPLPGVTDTNRLFVMEERSLSGSFTSTSYPDLSDYERSMRYMADLAAYTMTPVGLSAGDRTDRVWGELVSGNYFEVMGMKPVLGRTFRPEEGRVPGAYPVVVLSYGLWVQRFNADPGILGTTINLNSHPFTVIGVAPKNFFGSFVGLSMDLWIPIMMQKEISSGSSMLDQRGSHWLLVFVRPKPGVSAAQAHASLASTIHELAAQYPATNNGRTATLLPIWKSHFGAPQIFRPVLTVLMVVVGVVLLIACANVANLILARSLGRRKEIAIRLSVGANRIRLVRQLLTESTLLALLGGVAGLGLAHWGAALLSAFSPPANLPIHLTIETDGRVLAFTFLVSVLTGLVFGLVPALHSSNPHLVTALKDETVRMHGRSRMRTSLVTLQVALSLVLLIAAALFLQSLKNAQTIDPGFDPNNVLVASYDLLANGYSSEQGKAFQKQLLDRVQGIPGVQSVSLIRRLPLGFTGGSSSSVTIDGYVPKANEEVVISMNWMGPDYFHTMRTPILKGRDFTLQDEASTQRYVIINQAMADRYWRGRDPVGQKMQVGSAACEVIGVVKTGKYESLGEDPVPYMFFPLLQFYHPDATLVVRVEGDPAAYQSAVRAVVHALDSRLPLFDINRLSDYMGTPVFAPRMAASILGLFGILALILATVGLYSVMAYSVMQRSHEIGIRMALGAQRKDVLSLVVKQGLFITGTGIALGLLGAFGVTRFARSLLFGISPADPLTYIGLSLLLFLVAILACLIPARRATQIDPLVALRYE
jgi:macrolide transport system ATP-binding/permease protein